MTAAAEREEYIQGIAKDPANVKIRLKLAESYYKDGLLEYCARELIEIQRYISGNQRALLVLNKILTAIPYVPTSANAKNTVAMEQPRFKPQSKTILENDKVIGELEVDLSDMDS